VRPTPGKKEPVIEGSAKEEKEEDSGKVRLGLDMLRLG
jgi:hypothetical protein